MHPSEYEIQREVEALRDIRRRSTAQGGPGALILDPDLPNRSAPPSPTNSYWAGATPALTDGESATSSLEGDDDSGQNPNNPADDPFHLFWVPASLHPEIAPAEFRAFLKEHARAPATEGTTNLQRSSSSASTSSSLSGLGRKKSMLSRPYKPSENGVPEDDTVVPVKRRSSVYMNQAPQLTISDLQKLELLADEASESDDPSKLRNILRRSLSLNMSPSVIDKMDQMPDIGDEADSPIIVPPPGQILRRAARTKIRKPGLPGDGGGHRFGASRRVSPRSAGSTATTSVQRISTSSSSSDPGDSPDLQRPRPFSGENDGEALQGMIRPESFSEETSIYEAYVREDDDNEIVPVVVTSPPSLPVDLPISTPPHEPEVIIEPFAPPPLHHPQPQRFLVPPSPSEQQPLARTPSPEDSLPGPSFYAPNHEVQPFPLSPAQQRKEKEKEKKSLFGKWGGDKGGKRPSKEKERENRERTEKEKEGGFFGSLFGSKRRQDDQPPSLGHGGATGRETAQALLGASKSSKAYVSPTSPISSAAINNYSRYPIHVERAIYRLSHIKLANPRRPLYEQVLISNLMFWYLGVINKTQNPTSPATSTPAATAAATQANSAEAEKEQKEREQREQEERLKAEQEKERLEKEKEMMEQKKKDPPRRGSLTKAVSTGNVGGGRRAEMPVRGPQYEMQHRVIEQEYNGFNGPSSNPVHIGRANSATAGSGVPQPVQYPQIRQPGHPPQRHPPQPQPQPQPQQPQQALNNFYYGGMVEQQQRGGPMNLPPGAMAPVAVEQPAWLSSPPASHPRLSTSPPPPGAAPPHPHPRRSRSPPPPQHMMTPNRYQPADPIPPLPIQTGGKTSGRSLSATVVPSPHLNGKSRKGASVSVAGPNGRRPRTSDGLGGDQEDVPLALTQQQRWK